MAVEGGRAKIVADRDADATLHLDVEALNALLCGRWDAATAIDRDRLRIDGDIALGGQVADAMAYVF